MKICCPSCRLELPTKDQNISTDLAFCSDCNETYSLINLIDDGCYVESVDPKRPPEKIHIHQDADELDVFFWTTSWAALVFIPFATVFTAIPSTILYFSLLAGEFSLLLLVIVTPFFMGGILLMYFALKTSIGWERLTIKDGIGVLEWGFGPCSWGNEFHLAEVRGITTFQKDEIRTKREESFITIHGKTSVTFGKFLEPRNCRYVANLLRNFLFRPRSPKTPPK